MSAIPVARPGLEPVPQSAPGIRQLRPVEGPDNQPPPPGDPAAAANSGSVSRLRAAADHREVCAVARGTVQAAIEVLAGTRPVHQLARRLDQQCLSALQQRAALIRRNRPGSAHSAPRLHRNPAVRSIRASEVTPDIYEASAVVVDELRARAVAVRLERSNQVWRVTVLEIG